jgi:hypothetical protein
MMIVFYNKPLLRTLVLLAGITLAYVGYGYVSGMTEVLGRQGTLDSLAILGYVAASYIVLLVAEVADSHYVRAFGGISFAAGLATAWHFLSTDITKMPSGGAPVLYAFAIAALIGAAYLVIVVVRLILDRLNLGRPMISEASRIAQFDGAMEHPAYRERAAEPKLDKNVWDDPSMMPDAIHSSSQTGAEVHAHAAPAETERKPVMRIVGIGGAHSGAVFMLTAGDYTLGRSDACEICLAGDNQVSRAHSRISVDENGFATLTDLGSTNGTLVNGVRITTAPLAPGMAFVVGTTTFKVE